MSERLRELTVDDQEHINILCETIWGGNDYVPAVFPRWVSTDNSHTIGFFEENELIAVGNLERTEGTNIAWVQGLRVKDTHRDKGYATKVTNALSELAKEDGMTTLWYATSSRNKPSISVALKTGFTLVATTGYFRLYNPFPDHAKPSQSIVPIQVNPERLFELLEINPDLVKDDKFPLAWHFDYKTIEGLTRLTSRAINKVVIDEAGIPQAVYCVTERERKEEKTSAYTVFATDRAIFVDIMSRMIDESETAGVDRAVFFLGPNTTEWAQDLGYVTEEFTGRRFLLYEKKL
ncbi:MAG: GNAT family N-acetyltransferase [Candidatus Thorarchaeota archaeon]|jgi:GNAT superfamily N-acetyltransferase